MMTPRQQRFVQEYLVDLCATKAAIRAGYSQKTARAIGQENLTKPDISRAIERAQAARSLRTELTQDLVVQQLAAIAFGDIRLLFDDKGNLKPIQELEDGTAAMLAGVECGNVSGSVNTFYRIRLWDKLRALELLGKHLGLWSKNVLLQNTASVHIELVQFGSD